MLTKRQLLTLDPYGWIAVTSSVFPASWPFFDMFHPFFIMKFMFIRQSVFSVAHWCPMSTVHQLECLQVFVLIPVQFCFGTAILLSLQLLLEATGFLRSRLILAFSRFSSSILFSRFLRQLSCFALRRRSSSWLANEVMATSALRVRISHTARFQFRWQVWSSVRISSLFFWQTTRSVLTDARV